ncbi:hypothetical protein [Luteolibacter sp. AS25]|uniref:hypothetical protein n=1 Tax=Luteolibacter sp. AS25 TaxID=3135776 RepID=UPI00398AD082
MIALLACGVHWSSATPVVEFEVPSEALTENNEGVVSLVWSSKPSESGQIFELEQSGDSDFGDETVNRYTGPDLGSVLTGFPEGEYHFRVRSAEPAGDWSEPVAVEIKFMERSRVLWLMAVGVVVFLATIGTLLAGHFRKHAE